jgi:hypothetical protein
MAKKRTRQAGARSIQTEGPGSQDAGTALRTLAQEVLDYAERGRAPHIEVPSRSLSNVRFNQSRKIIEMGSGTNRRELFNLAQAKSYMQTLLVSSGCKQLIEQGKTTSIRGMFYLLKHTIEGTREETFDTQDECDPIIEDVEVMLDGAPRRAAPVRPETRRNGGADHDRRQGRRNRLLADGIGRLLGFRRSSSPTLFSSRNAKPTSSCMSKRTRFGNGSTRIASGKRTAAY